MTNLDDEKGVGVPASEVWAEIDVLRGRAAMMEAALLRALADVGCLHEDKCPHWVEWHNMARSALPASAIEARRAIDSEAGVVGDEGAVAEPDAQKGAHD